MDRTGYRGRGKQFGYLLAGLALASLGGIRSVLVFSRTWISLSLNLQSVHSLSTVAPPSLSVAGSTGPFAGPVAGSGVGCSLDRLHRPG